MKELSHREVRQLCQSHRLLSAGVGSPILTDYRDLVSHHSVSSLSKENPKAMWHMLAWGYIKFTEKKVTNFVGRLEFKKGFEAEEV